MSAARRKGTATEAAVVACLREHGYPHAERRALHDSSDRGDVIGVTGVAIEVKDESAPTRPAKEAGNAGAALGVVIRRRRGRPDVGGWFAVPKVGDLLSLLNDGDKLQRRSGTQR